VSLSIRLLGSPQLSRSPRDDYRFRSRKSWALLAYLLLEPRPPSRAQLAALLFDSADDPVGALRWSLSEVRKGLGDPASIVGDPVSLRRPEGARIDVELVHSGSWQDAVALPQLGHDLLAGPAPNASAAYVDWLAAERFRAAAATESILHEAALGVAAAGDLVQALAYAQRAAELSPWDENHQSLLISLYRRAGRRDEAEQHLARFAQRISDELGIQPGAALIAAATAPRLTDPPSKQSLSSVQATVESGEAAVAAGAVDTGIDKLRLALSAADHLTDPELKVRVRMALATTLVHSLRGFDEEGMVLLVEADRIALEHDMQLASATARAELGYIDFLRARYDRAEVWLNDALELGASDRAIIAKAHTYLGSIASDRGDFERALEYLGSAVEAARATGDPKREAFALSMVGRAQLALGDVDAALASLGASTALSEKTQWLSFVPWPQALLGEAFVVTGDLERAEQTLHHSFARACELGDPCWEGMAARSFALLHESRGDVISAVRWLDDGRRRCGRLSDPYVWLEAAILETKCDVALRHGLPELPQWGSELYELSARSGMRGFLAKARRAIGAGVP
jgi:DNA-binding SARP family transcriptional activator